MQDDVITAIVGRCEAQLVAARQAIDETLALMRDFRAEVRASVTEAVISIDDERGEALIAGARPMGSDSAAALDRSASARPFLLSYSEHHEAFRIGSRRLILTQTEKRILDLLWDSAPKPISREWIADALASSPGSIDTLVSNLRKKLDLLSDGRSHIESVRGQGWVLRPELCSLPTDILQMVLAPREGARMRR